VCYTEYNVAFKMAQSLRELVVRRALKRSLQTENPSPNVRTLTEKRQKTDGTRGIGKFMAVLNYYRCIILMPLDHIESLCVEQGKTEVCIGICRRALEEMEQALGPNHTKTLDAVGDLGNLYENQGKLKEAKEMYQRALEGYERALGPDHTSTLDAVHNLGLLYYYQGKLKEAEEMCQCALGGYERALGPDNTSTLAAVHNLSLLYSDQGKLEEAEEMYQRALKGYEKTLGLDHTSTIDIVNNLGNLYYDETQLKTITHMASEIKRLGQELREVQEGKEYLEQQVDDKQRQIND
jgi:tetratricopeptide (TPR) repeat protein